MFFISVDCTAVVQSHTKVQTKNYLDDHSLDFQVCKLLFLVKCLLLLFPMQMCKFGIEFTGENVNPTLFKNYLFPLAMQKFGVAS